MGTVLSVSELTKSFEVTRGAFSLKKETIHAVRGVSFDLATGETVGIVGESGSGKSTLARCILLLEKSDTGTILFNGHDLAALGKKALRRQRKGMQMIFQDPYSSLNPRKKVKQILGEPMAYHGVPGGGSVVGRVKETLSQVGLGDEFLEKYPHEMSGGQRQRIAIGRAISTNPDFIVADEPVSSLDVSVQAQIINLFLDIRERMTLSMLFVSHDLNIVRFVSDSIIVMYDGRIVEMGKKDEVFRRPLHPYTKMLIAASQGELERGGDRLAIAGQSGCPYATRCCQSSRSCFDGVPPLTGDDGHKVACYNA